MLRYVAISIEVAHAVLMTAWIVALPLLFWHRWPRLSRAAAVYGIAFAALSQASHFLMGECFLTRLTRWFWEREPGPAADTEEWFSIRLAKFVFQMAPTHRSIVIVSEALVIVTAVGVLVASRAQRGDRSQRVTTGAKDSMLRPRRLACQRQPSTRSADG
jgi:hypothetical protein